MNTPPVVRRALLSVMGLVAAMLAGCSAMPCTTIGYSSVILVDVSGNEGAVKRVEVCVGESCSGEGSAVAPTGGEPDLWPKLADAGQDDDGNHAFMVWGGSPTEMMVRAYDAAGAVLAERNADLEWRRVGGTERCGGPMEAGPVELPVS